VVFGPLKEPDAGHDGHDDHGDLPADLSPREIGVLVPLAVLCVVFGLQPGILTDRLERPVEILLVDAGYPDAVRAQLEQREDAPARMAEDETPAAPDGATAAADAADAVDAAAAADAADPAAATPAELVLTGDAPATPFELVEEPVDG
jgi:hypothetical protein